MLFAIVLFPDPRTEEERKVWMGCAIVVVAAECATLTWHDQIILFVVCVS